MPTAQPFKQTVLLMSLLIVLVAFAILLPMLILGGAKPVSLHSAEPIVGAISQALVNRGDTKTLPVLGTDYALENTVYLNNKDWVVTTIKPLGNNTGNVSQIVLKKQGNIYIVVLGPGSAFPRSAIQNFPVSVANYLNRNGVVYEPSIE